MKIIIGSDHAGFSFKSQLITHFTSLGLNIEDVGAFSEESVDYPDFAHALCLKVLEHNTLGVLLCGSGNGVNITANKHKGIRAALCWSSEIAHLARQHNNANVLSIPARFISLDEAKACVKEFIETPFEGGRHETRVNKIEC